MKNTSLNLKSFFRSSKTMITSAVSAIVIVVFLFACPNTFAQVMSSPHYSMEAESVNFAGGNSVSPSYGVESTAGEAATGFSSSAHNIVSAGYQLPAVPSAPTPTTTPPTPVIPPTSSSGSSSGGGGYVIPLPNPSGFYAVGSDNGIDLSWSNPIDPRFISVRIMRSNIFFPNNPNDGQLIYEGSEQSFFDASAVVGKTYYYAIFAEGTGGLFSSGALASTHVLSPGESPSIIPSGNPFANIPMVSTLDPMIARLSLPDFEFIQEGVDLPVSKAGMITVDGMEDLTIRLPYGKVPQILKTIAVALNDPQDSSRAFVFLLRANADKTHYEATIGSLGRSGDYPLSITVMDYQNRGLKKLGGDVSVLSAAAINAVPPQFFENLSSWIIPTLLLVLLIIIIAAVFLIIRKRRNASKVLAVLLLALSASMCGAFIHTARADFNQEINYQGKLMDASNNAVADGNYNVRFGLYTAASGGSPLWTETDVVPLKSGLFSAMLGSVASFTEVDFNQTLYLGVEIGGSGASPVWDGEMTPRKVLGAVPAAFVAGNALTADNALTANTALTADSLSGVLGVGSGGTGTSTVPMFGKILIGNNSGGYDLMSTSSMNIMSTGFSGTTDNITEGSTNLYYHNSLVQTYLDLISKGYFFATTSAGYFLSQNQGNAFSTTSTDYWKTQNNFFSTTSAGYFLSQNQGNAFSTTSANYWDSLQSRWATTSTDYWLTQKTTDALSQGSTNLYYNNSLVNSYVNGSSTIAKLYTANAWNALQTFGNNISLGGAQLNMGALAYGNLMSYNGTNWVNAATSTLGLQPAGNYQTFGNYITALTGDVTASGPGSAAATIGNGKITSAMLSNTLTLPLASTTGTLPLASTTGTTDNIAEGANNLYFTAARASTTATSILSATTSLPNITTLAGLTSAANLVTLPSLSLPATQLTGFGVPFYSFFHATTTDALSQGSTNLYYNNSLVNSYVNGSSTIAKLYTANAWNALQTFGNNISLGGAQLNMGALAYGNLMSYNGTNWVNAATSSLNLTIPMASTTGTLAISNGGTGQTSFGQGWLNSNGTTISASTSPTVAYITATSTTATSTFSNVSIVSALDTGVVAILKPNGTRLLFHPSADTDIARGNALLAATTSLSNGDTMELGAGTYDIGFHYIDLSLDGTKSVNLIGSSRMGTVIKSSYGSVAGQPFGIINSGISSSTVAHLSIMGTAASGNYQFPYALMAPTGVARTYANALLQDVYISGETDGIYVHLDQDLTVPLSTLKVEDTVVQTKWDSVALFGFANVNVDDSTFVADADSSLSIPAYGVAHNINCETSQGTINVNNSSFTTHGPVRSGGTLPSEEANMYVVSYGICDINIHGSDLTEDNGANFYSDMNSGGPSATNIFNSSLVSTGNGYNAYPASGPLNIYNSSLIANSEDNVELVSVNNNYNLSINVYDSALSSASAYNIGSTNDGDFIPAATNVVNVYGGTGNGPGGSYKIDDRSLSGGYSKTIYLNENIAAATVNSFPYYASTTLLQGTNMFYGSSTGNIGIGTTSPFAALSVNGSGFFGGNLTATGTLNVSGATILAGLTANSLSVGSLSGLLFGTNGSVSAVSTSTLNINTDNLVQGNTNKFYADSLVNSYVNGSSTIAKLYTANAWNALQTFGNNISLGGAQLNMGALAYGNLMSYNGTNWVNAATSSLNLSIPLASTTGTLSVSNGGTGQISFGQGWLYSNGGTGALAASTSPTVAYITATSTTASVFPYASTTALTVSGLASTSNLVASNSFTLANLTGLLFGTNGVVSSLATSSLNLSIPLASTTGTTDNIAQGSTNRYYSDNLVNSYVNGSSTIAKLYTANAWNALQTFGNNISLGGAQLNMGALAYGNLMSYNGTNWVNAATSSLNLSIPLASTTGTLSVSNGGTGQTSFGQGWIYSNGGTGALVASTSPTVAYIVATSSIASILPYASTTALSATILCLSTDCRTAWPTGGGGIAGTWSTTTSSGQVINYSNGSNDIVAIGAAATTTAKYWFDPNTQTSFLSGSVGIGTTSPFATLSVAGNTYLGGNMTATGTITFPALGGNVLVALNSAGSLVGTTSPTVAYITATSTTATSTFAGGLQINNNVNVASGGVYEYNGVNLAYGNTALSDFFFGDAGNLTMYAPGNTATGYLALYSNSSGFHNSAYGNLALYSNSSGSYNNAYGDRALYSNTTGYNNIANGSDALYYNDAGYFNVANGIDALYSNTAGYFNVADGSYALYSNTTGYNNTALGFAADVASVSLTNATAIGANAIVGASNSLVLGGTGANAVNVGIGTTSPFSTLSVVGSGYFSGSLTAGNMTATGTITVSGTATSTFGGPVASPSGNLIVASAGTTNNLLLNPYGGPVGIGVTNPSDALDVNGTVGITGGGLVMSGNLSMNLGQAIYLNGPSNWDMSILGDSGSIYGHGSNALVLNPGFHNKSTIVFASTTGSDYNHSIYFDNTGIGVGVSYSGGGHKSMLDVAGNMSLGAYAGVNAAPTNGLIVSGNVGLGTTSPFAKLSIAGTAGGALPLFAISTSTSGFATSTAIQVDQNGNLSLYNGASISTPTLYAATICITGDVCKTAWPADVDAAGGGTWSTTTSSVAGEAVNHSNNNTDIVSIGGSSTTTAKMWFDPNANTSYIAGSVGISASSTATSSLSVKAPNPASYPGTVSGIYASNYNQVAFGSLGFDDSNGGCTILCTTAGVYGSTINDTYGVVGIDAHGAGTGVGVYGVSNGSGDGVYGSSVSGYAVYAAGKANVTGTLSANTLNLTNALTVGYGGTGVKTFGQGWIYSDGGTGALSASTSPTVNYITATSTTATSTFANGINLTGGCFAVRGVCLNVATSTVVAQSSLYGSSLPNTTNAQVTLASYTATATSTIRVGGYVDPTVYAGSTLVVDVVYNNENGTLSTSTLAYTNSSGSAASIISAQSSFYNQTLWVYAGTVKLVVVVKGTGASGTTFNAMGTIELLSGNGSLGASQWSSIGANINYSLGNVGIGTTTPSATLGVAGTFYVGGTGTSTIQNNLDVLGTLHAKLSYTGDLFFANNFSFTEAPLDGTTQGLLLKNQNGAQVLSVDDAGNLSVPGDICAGAASSTWGGTCLGQSLQALNFRLNVLSSTTAAIDITTQVAALDLKVDALASTTAALASSKVTFADLASSTATIASSTAAKLSVSSAFIQTIANAVVAILQSSGQIASSAATWTVNEVHATLAVFTDVKTGSIETQTAAVSNGLEMTDSATGQVYCVRITNGNFDKVFGACGSVATSTNPVAASAPVVNNQSQNSTTAVFATTTIPLISTTTPIMVAPMSTGTTTPVISVDLSTSTPPVPPIVPPVATSTPTVESVTPVTPISPTESPVPADEPATPVAPTPSSDPTATLPPTETSVPTTP